MNHQRSVGRSQPALWAPPITAVSFERLAVLAANTFAWLIIAKLILK